jgi:RNA polymerase sigma-70 factor (ECF subfamily)
VAEDFSLAFPGTRSSTQVGLDATAPVDIAALVAVYSSLLFRVAYSILRNPAEAEDVVQDTFVRVLEHQSKLKDLRDRRVWLVRIAWNLALDRRRRIRPEQMDDLHTATLAGNDPPADVALQQAQQQRSVFRAIEALPKQERQALLLSALDELTAAEIAAVMKKSESAVRALQFRARTHLKSRLEKGGIA